MWNWSKWQLKLVEERCEFATFGNLDNVEVVSKKWYVCKMGKFAKRLKRNTISELCKMLKMCNYTTFIKLVVIEQNQCVI